MFNLKFFVVTFCNLFTIVLFIITYKTYTRQEQIILEQKPIKVEVTKIVDGIKSNYCEVKYNNNVFHTNLILHIEKGDINTTDFYYDEIEKEVFTKNTGRGLLPIGFTMFIISVFLWLVPKENFKW